MTPEKILAEIREVGAVARIARDPKRLRVFPIALVPDALKQEILIHAKELARLIESYQEQRLDYVNRFGSDAAGLYPWFGRAVATPKGPGIMSQVLGHSCVRVVIEDTLETFDWSEIDPLGKPS